uniref:Ovule protein n=1 Tax=Heterorhabditis bacteriophora TaxID=37862 RepID=A0A1I7WZ17_HETBA
MPKRRGCIYEEKLRKPYIIRPDSHSALPIIILHLMMTEGSDESPSSSSHTNLDVPFANRGDGEIRGVAD